jgi:glycosyltransferase involved in cell wall biosynthesis
MQSDKKYKIAFLIPYPLGVAPGQRFRFEQYISFLNDYGYETVFFPFINHELNALLYSKGFIFKKVLYLFSSYLKRFRDIYKIRNYDAVYLFRESCFLGPPIFEYIILKIYKRKVIFDFDDAIWLSNVSEANKMWKWLKFPKKTNFFLKNASVVTAGNNYLAMYAKKFSMNVYVIPTTIDTSYHADNKKHSQKNKIIIGWTGSETTIKYFEREEAMIFNLLKKYSHSIEFRVISNKPSALKHPQISFVEWKKETEIEDVLEFDIGIMPLPNDEWAKGKCGFKGLQYMSLGIPAVVSPVGVNTEIINNGINGFYAASHIEWNNTLSKLIDDVQLREKIGKEGKKTIEKYYSVNSQKSKYIEIFNKVFS